MPFYFFNVSSKDFSSGAYSLFSFFFFSFFYFPSFPHPRRIGLVSITLLQEAPCNLLEFKDTIYSGRMLSGIRSGSGEKKKRKQHQQQKSWSEKLQDVCRSFYIVEIHIRSPLVGKGVEITIWKNKENCFSPPA